MTSNRVPATYMTSDDRLKVTDLLPTPRPNTKAMAPLDAKAAAMSPEPINGDIPWSDLPCLWCTKTPTHPFQVDVFTLCHCTWQCASRTLLWLRWYEDEQTVRAALGVSDDTELTPKPPDQPTYEAGGGLFRSTASDIGPINVTFNGRPPKPGDRITLRDGMVGTVIQDEGSGKLSLSVENPRSMDKRALQGARPSMVIMDEADSVPAQPNDRLRRESLARQAEAAKRIRQERRGRF